jgi:ABC-type multidrug transport system permease subunit
MTMEPAVTEPGATESGATESGATRRSHDALFYLLAALFGIGAGFADVTVNDLLFTALLVLMACMLLGMLRPRWPWRWVIAVVIFIPIAELAAYLVMTVKPTRGKVYGSFLTALPGTAGAYGGAVVRQVIDNLRQKK